MHNDIHSAIELPVRHADRVQSEAALRAERREEFVARRTCELVGLMTGPGEGRGVEVTPVFASGPRAGVYLLRDFAAWIAHEAAEPETIVHNLLLGQRLAAQAEYAEARAQLEAAALGEDYWTERGEA